MRRIYDIVIVGSGIAGLSAAVFLKKAGFNVVVVTKAKNIDTTNTNLAQGGIIGYADGDNPALLKQDLLHAGCNYNNEESVELFVQEAPHLVNSFFIDELHVNFTRKPDGTINFTKEGSHSVNRILYDADSTGESLQKALIDHAKKLHIPILKDHTAIDIITNNHHSEDNQELYKLREVMGVYVLDNQKRIVRTLLAHKLILASGGIGNLYQHTTNPEIATGDGLSMAYRAGADIINAELIQFHPTALYHVDNKRFLISEALRGEGAKLIDHQGRKFMKDYSPQKDLAPRDIVARSIYNEMRKKGKDYMLLDLYHFYKGTQPISERFSKIYQTCLKVGIDITKEPIPIVPAAHYFCGGIKVDGFGRTSLQNLYAIGEVSCTGLHGANRLASSSLAEGFLWAKKAADDIQQNFHNIDSNRLRKIPDWQKSDKQIEFDSLLLEQDMKAIQRTMWNYAGIIRTRRGLDRARSDLNYYAHRIFKFYHDSRLGRKIIELRNAVVNASIIVNAASHNKRSIGCHYVIDDR